MNTGLLRKVQKHILAEPRRFIMGDVEVQGKPGELYSEQAIDRTFPACGTMACIAGWVCILSGQPAGMGAAEELLGITISQSDRLFLGSYWPRKYRKAWDAAKSPAGRARVAVRVIDHFIKTKGEPE